MTVFPNTDWLNSRGLQHVVAVLSDGDARPRIVGGAVRDSLLNLPVADIDLATPLLPDAVIQRLEHNGIKAIPTGIDHGTITAVADGETFEITTLRRDVSTDGRRATVAFATDWKDDAARRDFTINALYADPITGEIFDYFGGLDDIKAHNVRFIGDADQRIKEDYLRILRFFRFYARFGKTMPDSQAIAAITANAKSLMALSRERISDELIKLLGLANPLASINLMVDHGIFAAFLPEIVEDAKAQMAQLLGREEAAGVTIRPGRRFNALLPKDKSIVELVGARLKLSNKSRLAMAARLSVTQPEAKDARAIAYRHGVDIAQDIFLLHAKDAELHRALEYLSGWSPPAFSLKGGALITRGLHAGKHVAETLKEAERRWIAAGFPDDAALNAIADQCVAEVLLAIKNS